jgi:uncharacterized protein YuzE
MTGSRPSCHPVVVRTATPCYASNMGRGEGMMRLEYDPWGDIAYIYVGSDLNTAVNRTERVAESDEYDRGIDYDTSGAIVGYEFMNASHGLNLEGLPHQQEIAAFIGRVANLRVLCPAS